MPSLPSEYWIRTIAFPLDAFSLPLPLKSPHQADQALIERWIAAETVIDSVGFFGELWQFFVELIDRESGIGAVFLFSSLVAHAPSRPHFAFPVLRLNEQDEPVLGVIRRYTNTTTTAIIHGTYDFTLMLIAVLNK